MIQENGDRLSQLAHNGLHNGIQDGTKIPPDSYRTIDELLRTQAACNSGQPVVFYPSSTVNYVGYSMLQLDSYAFRAAELYIPDIPARKSSSEEPMTVGLLGVSDLDYITTILALTKLGHTVMFLSPRLTTPAYQRLLNDTNTKYVVVQPAFREKICDIPGVVSIPIVNQTAYDRPISQYQDTNLTPAFDMTVEHRNAVWVFHSSGSTGPPKAVRLTQRGALANYQRNIKKFSLRCFLTLPLFHTHGIASLFRAMLTGVPVYLYNVSLPLTKDYLIQTLESHDFEIFSAVPYALKVLSESTKGIELLKRLKLVTFGGSPCPDSLGDMLVDKGVNLVSRYGMSETGPLMTSNRPKDDKYWNYLRPTAETEPYISFEPRGEGLYELVCLDGLPSKAMSNREDGSYATKDLFMKHPTINAWKYCGRNDDVIVLENGEKVNPIDIEGAVVQHPLVAAVVVFGVGKPYPGMLIIPESSDLPQTALLEQIWPEIEAAQAMSPEYAKISKEMVVILPQGTSYPKTDKGTIIRKAFYNQFSEEITQFYNNTYAGGAVSLTATEMHDLVQSEVSKILSPVQVAEDTDFFELGLNSLQASRLRGFLVRKINFNGQSLGFNVVFDHPTIRSLSTYLYSIHRGLEVESQSNDDQIRSLIAKYNHFKQHVPRAKSSEGEHIVLTGATGSLGAHMLAILVRSNNVKKVYCLVRASSPAEARNRVIQSLHLRKLYTGLSSIARQKVICLQSDLSLPSLGLEKKVFEKITSEITILYHCAWNVNFNLRLSSFERDCIAGLKNLIDLCLEAHGDKPATFSFCSSVGTVVRTQDKTVPEALPTHFSNAQTTGYGQSKLVAEHLCMNAVAQVGIRAYILRIGQIIGDTSHGIWNSSEAIPLMIQTAKTINALPSVDEDLRWTPVDVVARAVIEISNSRAATGVFNLINPRTIHWNRDLLPYLQRAGLKFDIVDPPAWLKLLQASNDPVANPPLKLLEHFRRRFDASTARSAVEFETQKSQRWSDSFSKVQAPDQSLVTKMIQQFTTTSWNLPLQPQLKLRPVVAFSSSASIPVGNSEFAAVDLVASLVSMRLGIPVLDSLAVGFSKSVNGVAATKVNGKAEELTDLNGPVTGPHSTGSPALTIVDRDDIRNVPSCRVRFLIITAGDDLEKSRISAKKGENIDVICLDVTGDTQSLVEEAVFWTSDFL
ncbi:putative NRPS-like enzyme [Xylogone sp. PMI_703]|nr:putative NRPS-like enzyme [Xylogone sp. PMI_703]